MHYQPARHSLGVTTVPQGTITPRGENMIRFVRTACIAPGKFGDALAFAKQISEFINKHYGVKLEIMLPVGGNPQRIAWRTEYPNLGAMDEFQSKLLLDSKFMELSSKGAANFVAGSMNDVIWRTV